MLLRLTNDFSLNEFEDEDLSELTEITDQFHDQVGELHQPKLRCLTLMM